DHHLHSRCSTLDTDRIGYICQAIKDRQGNPTERAARSERRHFRIIEMVPPEPTEWHGSPARRGPADREEDDRRAGRSKQLGGQEPTGEREAEPDEPAERDPGGRGCERDPERTLHVRRGGRRLHAVSVSA